MTAWTHFSRRLHAISSIAAVGTLSITHFNVIADNTANIDNDCLRVAIIGSGVGGASTAYFLRELLHKYNIEREVIMDMYEKNDYVGGRVKCVNLDRFCGGEYIKDIGATIMIKQNQYMMNFGQNVLNLDLKMLGDDNELRFAFFDEPRGKLSVVWDESFGSFKLIKQWGFLHFIGLMYTARKFVKNFGKIYDLQRDEKTFDNAIDFWNALDLQDSLYGNGMEFINKEINKFVPSFLTKRQRFHSKWAPSTLQLVTALTRNNYTQEPEDLPPIVTAGAVSTLAARGLCRIANGGNSLIEKGLIELSETNLNLNYEIKSIARNNQTNKYILNNNNDLQYDYVIIAAPLSLANIEFNIHSKQIDVLSKQEYMDVHKHYVKGTLSAKYFGFCDNNSSHLESVGSIFSSNLGCLSGINEQRVTHKTLPCTTIGIDNDSEWIIFMGAQRFTHQVLDEIMDEWDKDSLQAFHFKAYPKFKWNRKNIDCLPLNEQKKILRFCMDKNKNGGLYYLNALECGMSAQEVMAVAAKNVALLVSKQIVSSSSQN